MANNCIETIDSSKVTHRGNAPSYSKYNGFTVRGFKINGVTASGVRLEVQLNVKVSVTLIQYTARSGNYNYTTYYSTVDAVDVSLEEAIGQNTEVTATCKSFSINITYAGVGVTHTTIDSSSPKTHAQLIISLGGSTATVLGTSTVVVTLKTKQGETVDVTWGLGSNVSLGSDQYAYGWTYTPKDFSKTLKRQATL